MKELEKTFKIFADETRLRIIKLLQNSVELCVCEIMQAIDKNQATVSKALSVLKNGGFVSVRREGLWMYYSINKSKSNKYFNAISSLVDKWENSNAQIVKDVKRLKSAKKASVKKAC